MRVGIPREVKSQEYRVGATPACVAAYVADGHRVVVEQGAGQGCGYSDDAYLAAGAVIAPEPGEVWDGSDMVIKVKEPLVQEYPRLRPGLVLFTYLHLAADPALATALIDAQVSAVAYETIVAADGSLPCLGPMSAIAGRLSIQQGAKYLEKPFGGRGVLLGGVPGVPRARVVVVGGGVVGTEAARMASGLGADVTVFDVSQGRLFELDRLLNGRLEVLMPVGDVLDERLRTADLVIGAVLVPGAAAPKVVQRRHLSTMKSGSLIVDVAVDQGGCAETSRPTTHARPTFSVDGVQHYCVANMPAAVPVTATAALVQATLPLGRKIASLGIERAIECDVGLAAGLNIHQGCVRHPVVAAALGLQSPAPR